LAGSVIGLLRGRVVVAHNWAFDGPFLAAEFARAGVEVPLQHEAGLCTMHLAGQFLPETGRGLADCCRSAGIALTHAHSALHDALAAAQLLAYFLSVTGQPPPWTRRLSQAAALRWPPLDSAYVAAVGRREEGQPEDHFLSRLVDRLPRMHRPDADAYLEVLDRALLDRHVSTTEAEALVAVADRLGLGRTDVVALHEQYLQALAAVAVLDGAVTRDEQQDLETVASLLGLEPAHVDHVLRLARHAIALTGVRSVGQPRSPFRPGDTVVFTGEMDEPREIWEARARAAGLIVEVRVTRKTRVLVAADPDSMSGKAQRAANYGIPVVHPAAFMRMIGSSGSSNAGQHSGRGIPTNATRYT
jgi:DNA polymerase-3 subunit epsilon